MKVAFLILAYLGIVTLPLVLSWAAGVAPRDFRHEIASGMGMLAFSMILVEFVLSGRSKAVSRGIGMDVTMRFHQLMARTALVFALIHPFLYGGSLAGGVRPWDVTRQLTWTTDFESLSTGILAFLLLPVLVLSAMSRRKMAYRYEIWRALHGFGALAIALLLLHHTTHAGRYGQIDAVALVWKGMTGLAVGTLVYVYVIEPLRQTGAKWRVSGVTRLSPRQWELQIEPVGHAGLSYRAGQFAWLNVGHSPFSLHENPFSISSAPAGGADVSFLIKELGDFSGSVGQIKVGTRAYLDGPYGSLSVEGRREPGIALIAGGVGLAPLLGILRQIRLSGDPRQIRIIYGNRTEEQIVYRAELGAEDVTYVLSEPPEGWSGETGLIDAALLDRVFDETQIRDWLFVLCGPVAMMNAVETCLIARGTPADRILSERFEYD